MSVTGDLIVLWRRFEGLRLRPYLCPAGVPTLGLGSTFYLDGRKVKLTDPAISEETAVRLAEAVAERVYIPGVLRLCPRAAENPGHLVALADFAYNLGVGRLASSTLRRKYNAGDLEGAKVELKKWVRGGGRVLPGLVLRRRTEAALL